MGLVQSKGKKIPKPLKVDMFDLRRQSTEEQTIKVDSPLALNAVTVQNLGVTEGQERKTGAVSLFGETILATISKFCLLQIGHACINSYGGGTTTAMIVELRLRRSTGNDIVLLSCVINNYVGNSVSETICPSNLLLIPGDKIVAKYSVDVGPGNGWNSQIGFIATNLQ